jgi:predicted metal-dependent peptidase
MNANMHEKILQCTQEMLIDLQVNLPYYGNFLLFMSFHERKDIKTCAVNITSQGMNFYYNTEFLDGKTQKEVNFIVIHEIFHLLWSHPKRTISGQYEHRLANIAQDMIINHIIWCDISRDFVQLPKNGEGKNMTLFIPKEYKGSLIFEEIYEWLRDARDKRNEERKRGGGNSGGNGGGNSNRNTPDYGPYGRMPTNRERDQNETIDTYSLDHIFDNIDNSDGMYLDQHLGDEVPEEMRDAVVKDIMDRLQARGFESGNVTESLNKLRKKRKDYLSYIKRCLSNQIFGTKKQKTIVKPNRRNILGLKGNRKVKTKITAILDTSGSMGGTFERILSYIYRNDIEVNLIEADTSVKWIQNIKNKRQLETTIIKGGGGTILQPAIDYVVENFNDTNLVVLTDGYCDNLNLSKINGNILMISIGDKVPISKTNGKVKQILVEKTGK